MKWIILLCIIAVGMYLYKEDEEQFSPKRIAPQPPVYEPSHYETSLTRPKPAELLVSSCVENDVNKPCDNEIVRRSTSEYYTNFEKNGKTVSEVYDAMVEDFRHVTGKFETVEGADDNLYDNYKF